MASFTLSSSFRRTLQLASPHQQLHRPQSLTRTLPVTVTATRAFSSIRSSRRLNNPSIPLQLSHNHFRLTSSHHHAKSFHSTASTMGVHNVANKAEFDAALKEHKVVVLDAFATWCGPCKMIAPQVVKFSEQYTNAYFIKLDVDEVPDVAQELAIRAMPTFLIFKDGEKFHSVVGANPRALVDGIEKALA